MSWKNGSYSTPRCRGAAPTTPSSRVRSATRSTIVCVSKTLSATCSDGKLDANSQSRRARTTPPGPVEAPISKVPASSPLGLVGELVDDLLLELQQPLRAAVEAEPRLGRLDAAAGAVEQLHPEPPLERAHLQRDGGLGHAEPLRSLRERPALDHRAEGLQLPRVHKQTLSQTRATSAGCRTAVPGTGSNVYRPVENGCGDRCFAREG